jgi:NAD(P)-dependent dehydrogenase (short-subunit alcohol dehydrogenase family)
MSARELEGRVALVTGSTDGIGLATARALAVQGCAVMLNGFGEPAAVEALRAGIAAEHGVDVAHAEADLRDGDAASGLVARTLERFGRLDVLVNNAGTDITVSIEELTVADWDRVLRTNLRGPFLLAKAALPGMRQQGEGHIVNIVSTAAKRAWANAAAYHASKWGLLGFSHALHVEARPHNVKVTAVIAGGMRTPFLLDRFPDIDVNVLQDPRSVAEAVRFVLTQPVGTVIPELMVLPMRETSWP